MFRFRDVFAAILWLLFCVGNVQAQNAPEPRLYFFTQSACPPCQLQKPEIDRLVAAGYPIQEIDVQSQPQWAQKFQVHRTPTLILVWNNQVVRLQDTFPQPVSAEALVGWFQALTQIQVQQQPAIAVSAQPDGSQNAPASFAGQDESQQSGNTSSTTAGDRKPRNSVEAIALNATVRIKVAEPDAFSFATGTIVHAHGKEAIVLTCGHVFRDSNGQGEITAEFGWGSGDQTCMARGRLLAFDAGPRDVALVQIVADRELPSIPVAPLKMVVSEMDEVFTIGCDHGEPPTIRRTRIKCNQDCDGVEKYIIYGRPVEGRSGGGLFSAGGQLLGVCNAALVEHDEGIYSSLPNIWGEFARTGLDRVLLAPSLGLASNAEAAGPIPQAESNRTMSNIAASPSRMQTSPGSLTLVSNETIQPTEGMQLIAVIRDRITGQAMTIVIDHPEAELLEYLSSQNTGPIESSKSDRADRMAELRQTIPGVPNPFSSDRGTTARAQSPDPSYIR